MKRQLTGLAALLLLSACGSNAPAAVVPTPTPLPPNPALEKTTYTVTRGPIERVLEVTGRVTPVDSTPLAFKIDGKLETLNIERGSTVKAGDVLGTLRLLDAQDELRAAEDALAQQQRELENARKTQARVLKERERALESANEVLAELLPGGEQDVLRAAQLEVDKAERALRDIRADQADGKVDADDGVTSAADGLIEAQRAWSKAYWDNDWAQKYGTDPANPTIPDPNRPGKTIPNKLTDAQKEEFANTFRKAQLALDRAERAVEKAKETAGRSRETELLKIQEAEDDLKKKRAALDKLTAGKDSKELREARDAVENARAALDELRSGTGLADQIKAVENAQRELEKKRRKVADGQLIAPRDGEVIAVRFAAGENVTAFDPVLEIADPTRLEIAATLGADQTRELAEGQPAEVTLLTRPDVVLEAIVRKLPGAAGGTVGDRDPTTRLTVTDAKGVDLPQTAVVTIRFVLEKKPDVLLLPPEAVRSFEGRRFVVIRETGRDRRVPVRTGISTDKLVEVLEGVSVGDTVVGQ